MYDSGERDGQIKYSSSLHCQRDEVTLFVFPLHPLVRMMKQSPINLIHSLVVGKNTKTKTNLDAMTKGWNGDFSLTSFHWQSNINEKQNKLQP